MCLKTIDWLSKTKIQVPATVCLAKARNDVQAAFKGFCLNTHTKCSQSHPYMYLAFLDPVQKYVIFMISPNKPLGQKSYTQIK